MAKDVFFCKLGLFFLVFSNILAWVVVALLYFLAIALNHENKFFLCCKSLIGKDDCAILSVDSFLMFQRFSSFLTDFTLFFSHGCLLPFWVARWLYTRCVAGLHLHVLSDAYSPVLFPFHTAHLVINRLCHSGFFIATHLLTLWYRLGSVEQCFYWKQWVIHSIQWGQVCCFLLPFCLLFMSTWWVHFRFSAAGTCFIYFN